MNESEGRVHRPRKRCPHLAAEMIDTYGLTEDLADEFLRPLLPWAARVARQAGRNLPVSPRQIEPRPIGADTRVGQSGVRRVKI
jgi:hypothetical protein